MEFHLPEHFLGSSIKEMEIVNGVEFDDEATTVTEILDHIIEEL